MKSDHDRKMYRIVLMLARADGRLADGQADAFYVDDGVSLKRLRLPPDLRVDLLERTFIVIEADVIRLTPTGRAFAAQLTGHPEAFRLQHGAIRIAAGTFPDRPAEAWIDEAESPLAWLHRRKGPKGGRMLDEAEFRAGERLRLDFTKGGLMPSVTSNWRDMAASGGGGRGGRAEMTDAALAARDRVNAALKSLGPELAGVAIDVCCFLKGLETVESDRSWPQRSAKVVLQVALKALARHYGIAAETVAGAGNCQLKHWGANDYRPRIDGGR
jgi:hypothetical protein